MARDSSVILCLGTQLRLLIPVCQMILSVPPFFGVPGAGVGLAVCVGAEVGATVPVDEDAVEVGCTEGAIVNVVDASFSPQLINSMLPVITIAKNSISSFFMVIFVLPPLFFYVF